MSKTNSIKIGGVVIGGDAPIAVQTMWPRSIKTVDNDLIKDINSLEKAGCGIIRFAVPNRNSVTIIGKVATEISLPVVADIHFDYQIALDCLDEPIAKLRINPGNIGAEWKVREVARKACDKDIPIRIGVNGGSLANKFKDEKDLARAMVLSAEEEINTLVSTGFEKIVISLKASDIETTCRAYEFFAKEHSYPLHLGITEAGPEIPALVKSTLAFSRLLNQGIGDTIRVSISGEPIREVLSGREILRTLGLRNGANIVSCPGCARATFNTAYWAEIVAEAASGLNEKRQIAIMGCPVNGPGEAAEADAAITGTGNRIGIYKKGKKIDTVEKTEIQKILTMLLGK